MEGSQGGEAISDIHNYLDTFNKEIQTGDQPTTEVAQVFVDESGQYFYHNVDGTRQQMVVVSSEGGDTCSDAGDSTAPGDTPGATPVMLATEEDSLNDDGEGLSQGQVTLGEDGTLQVIPSMQQGEANNQVVLNTGDNNQIVTIVPSSTNPGEVSYVLIVESDTGGVPGSEKDDAIYDFNEGDEGLSYESGDEDEKKMMRIIHKKSQTVTQAHMCNYCNYTSPKRYLLSRHMKSHSEERPHKCSVCERGFKTLASLQNHVNTHTGIKPHRCKYCESTFTTSGELVRHVRYIHTHEKPHKCPDCDYASVELSKLKRHMRCHSGERPYQCPHCTYASPDTFKLKRHLRIHTGEKPYECEICHSRFTQSNSLKAHKLIHTGNKPVYACELCPTTCGRKTDLRIHVQKLHTSDKPLKCKKCGKAFPDRYTFKQHNKSHEGEKCFKCDLCPYASTSARHLESHMLVHTEQKPYQCDQCDQAFRQKQLLKRHVNLYHNPEYIPPMPREKTQECPECGKAFRHKGNLIRHMAIHDPDASAQEKAQALKIGRQKRLQLINGQQVEMYSGEMDEDEIMAVEGQDGNQYVVLEVIQLQDGEGHVMMSDGIPVTEGALEAAGGGMMASSPLMVPETITGDTITQDPIAVETGACLVSESSLLELNPHIKKVQLKTEELSVQAKKETQKEMETCFGFDDEDEGQIHLEFGECE